MILDTSAYSALQLGREDLAQLVRDAATIELPLQVMAELAYGFALGSRIDENERQLQQFLSQGTVSILMPTIDTARHYADLAVLCRRAGRVPSQNDMWIAALAHESDRKLVTYDKDFGVFQELFGKNLIILKD